MTYEIDYDVYNVGQYPELKGDIAARISDGWRVLNSQLNYNEVGILWHRGDPSLPGREDPEPAPAAPAAPAEEAPPL